MLRTNGEPRPLRPEVAHPDIVWDVSRYVFNPSVYRGYSGLRRFAEQVDETMWERFAVEPEEFIEAGENVVVAVRISGKGRGNGVEASMHLYGIWTLRAGKVSWFMGGYRDRAEALEAAGLSE